MAHYTKHYREEIDGTHLETVFTLDVYDLSILRTALEAFIYEGEDNNFADAIQAARLLQLMDHADEDHHDAEADRIVEQEAIFDVED